MKGWPVRSTTPPELRPGAMIAPLQSVRAPVTYRTTARWDPGSRSAIPAMSLPQRSRALSTTRWSTGIHVKRRVDRLADLGQTFRLTPSLSRLLDEGLHVVQRQGRVIGESLHQSDLRVRELPHGPIGHGESADDAATGLQRHRQ